jgi:hypothetical protein
MTDTSPTTPLTASISSSSSSNDGSMGLTPPAKQQQEQEQEREQQEPPPVKLERSLVWRECTFLLLGGIALRIVSYVETNAAYSTREMASLYEPPLPRMDGHRVIDTGFVLTYPLYQYLADHRDVNDILAALNSLLFVLPCLYAARVTLWEGDYTLSFRLLATQLFRSFCGWFTYLPPDPTFLMSIYDFPEIAQCMFQECKSSVELEPFPFVSFFSGHVASMVIIANHMYMRPKYQTYAVVFHALNTLQILRLLATRGHYSIDIIIGWVVAVYVSNPAERLGRYYSHGMAFRTFVPGDAREAFEAVIGLHDIRRGAEGLTQEDRLWLLKHGISSDCIESEDDLYMEGSATAAKVVAQMAGQWAKRNLAELKTELERHGMAATELGQLRRQDLIRLLSWAKLNLEDLMAEARRMDVKLPSNLPRMEILVMMLGRTRAIMEERARWASQWAQESLVDLRAELERQGMTPQDVGEMGRKDLVRLLSWTQLKMETLTKEANQMGLRVTEDISRGELLTKMWRRFKAIVEERTAMFSSADGGGWSGGDADSQADGQQTDDSKLKAS